MSKSKMDGDVSKNGKATAGFILGLLGLVGWILPIIGLPLTIIGLVLSIDGVKSVKRSFAVTGIVLSSIGMLLAIINGAAGAYLAASGQSSIVNKFLRNDSATQTAQTTKPDGARTKTNDTASDDSKSQFIIEAVKEAKSAMELPYKLDDMTSIVDITAEPESIRYQYLVTGVDTSKVKLTNELIKVSLVPSVCENNGLVAILNKDINLEYSYSVDKSEQKYFITVTKADCNE